MARKSFSFAKPSSGGGTFSGIDAEARSTAAANRALIDANKALITKMMRKAGDVVAPGEEVFVESPKVTNWANYTAADITVPDAPTAAKMRTAGFTELAAKADVGGVFMGYANTFGALPRTSNGRSVKTGDIVRLTQDDIGTGSTAAPQYRAGIYQWSGSTYVFAYGDPPPRPGVFMGGTTEYANLPTSASGYSVRIDDFAYLRRRDVGTGTVYNPQYPTGIYRWSGAGYVLESSTAPTLTKEQVTVATDDTIGFVSGRRLAEAVAAFAPKASETTQQTQQQQTQLDLSIYALKSEIPVVPPAPDLTPYALKSEVTASAAAVEEINVQFANGNTIDLTTLGLKRNQRVLLYSSTGNGAQVKIRFDDSNSKTAVVNGSASTTTGNVVTIENVARALVYQDFADAAALSGVTRIVILARGATISLPADAAALAAWVATARPGDIAQQQDDGSVHMARVTGQAIRLSAAPAAPAPVVWQETNANVNALITYNAANDITGVQFSYSDPEDETKTAVFSLADMVTGFSASGYYGGEARFIDATMPSGKVVKIILNKKSAKSLAIIVAKPGANLSIFGKIANVQITAPTPAFKEASYKVYSNADARQTVAQGAEIELNTVAMRENERGFVDADVLAANRIICPHAGVVSVMSMVYANTNAARASLVHYDAAGTVKRTFVMVAALGSGESKESATFNRVKVAAGDRFGLVNAASTSAQFFRGESHCELHVTYLPA